MLHSARVKDEVISKNNLVSEELPQEGVVIGIVHVHERGQLLGRQGSVQLKIILSEIS